MGKLIYRGPSSRDDISTEFQIRDAAGQPHVLRKGIVAEVPDELASEVLSGKSDRVKGHKFEAAPDTAVVGHAAEAQPADPSFDVDGALKPELEAEAARLGLTVEGTGSDGAVTADDLRAAIREHNQEA